MGLASAVKPRLRLRQSLPNLIPELQTSVYTQKYQPAHVPRLYGSPLPLSQNKHSPHFPNSRSPQG